MCSARSGQTDECHFEHLMAELEPFSDIFPLAKDSLSDDSSPILFPGTLKDSNEHSPIPHPWRTCHMNKKQALMS